jgi:selenocysteine-specific elongation factor
MLTDSHKHKPLAVGVGRRELLRGVMTGLGPQAFDALLKQLESEGLVKIRGPLVSLFEWEVSLSPSEIEAKKSLLAQLREAGLQAINISDLGLDTVDSEGLVGHLVEEGEVIRIERLLYLADSLKGVVSAVLEHFAIHEELSPAEFKQITGLSRKGAIPMLEWLDLQKITKRRGNARIMYQ